MSTDHDRIRRDIHAALDHVARPAGVPAHVLATLPERPPSRFDLPVPAAAAPVTAVAMAAVIGGASMALVASHRAGRAPQAPSSHAAATSTAAAATAPASPLAVLPAVHTPSATLPPVVARPTAHLSPTTAPAPPCTASQLLLHTSTDRSSYAEGQVVHVTATLQNRGATACAMPMDSMDMQVRDAGGHAVMDFVEWDSTGGTVAPGGTQTWTATWAQKGYGSGGGAPQQVSPGTYVIDVAWPQHLGDATATVQIDAPPTSTPAPTQTPLLP